MANTKVSELPAETSITSDAGCLYYVNPSGVSKKVTIGKFKEQVIQPVVERVIETIGTEEPDGINVQYSNPIPDWGAEVVLNPTSSTYFYLPMDCFMRCIENSSLIRVDGIKILPGLWENGINVAAGSYIQTLGAVNIYMYPLTFGNIYVSDTSKSGFNLTPWEFRDQLQSLTINGSSPFYTTENGITGARGIADFGIWGSNKSVINRTNFWAKIDSDATLATHFTSSSTGAYSKYMIYCPLVKTRKFLFLVTITAPSETNKPRRRLLINTTETFGASQLYPSVFFSGYNTKVQNMKISYILAECV